MKKIIAKIRFILDFFDNNKLIGAARLIDLDKDVIHIGRVAIDKEYRGRGIGRELINGCENIAQQILKRKIIIELKFSNSSWEILRIIRL